MIFIISAKKINIKIWKPIKLSEKISQKNPAIKAEKIPSFFSGASRIFIKKIETKIRLTTIPLILK
jgi:hypothetical protein